MCNVQHDVNLPLALVTSPLLVKIRRVYLIFEANKGMKRRKDLGLKPMMIFLFKILSITILILVVGAAVPNFRPVAQLMNKTRTFSRTSGDVDSVAVDTSDIRRQQVEEISCVEQGTPGFIFLCFEQ